MTSILFGIVRISSSLFKCNYLKNEKLFPNFLLHLWNLHQTLNVFEEKMVVIANVFSRLKTVKDLVEPISKNRRFITSYDSQHVKGPQTLVKSLWEPFYHITRSLWREMTWRISPWWRFEILGVFVNTLSADDKYPLRDCGNLQFPIQMTWCEKEKIFFSIFYLIYGISIKF